jgi:hypothetical protein
MCYKEKVDQIDQSGMSCEANKLVGPTYNDFNAWVQALTKQGDTTIKLGC